jgi:hypothetical protein
MLIRDVQQKKLLLFSWKWGLKFIIGIPLLQEYPPWDESV